MPLVGEIKATANVGGSAADGYPSTEPRLTIADLLLSGSYVLGLQSVALAVLGPFGVEALYSAQHLFVHVGKD